MLWGGGGVRGDSHKFGKTRTRLNQMTRGKKKDKKVLEEKIQIV
jgi:hypothetical protein